MYSTQPEGFRTIPSFPEISLDYSGSIHSYDWIKTCFVHDLPPNIQSQLIAASCLQLLCAELSKVLNRAKSLVTESENTIGAVEQLSTEQITIVRGILSDNL